MEANPEVPTGEEEAQETQEVQEAPEVDPLGEVFEPETKVEEVTTTPKVEETVPTTDKPEEDKEPEKEELSPEKEETPEIQGTIEPTPEMVALEKENAGLKAAMIAERRQRQLAQGKTEPEPELFSFDDPEKSLNDLGSRLETKFETKFLEMSENQCKARNQDYDAKYQVFVDMCIASPALVEDMRKAADPAQYAYDLAKDKMFMDEVGKDPGTYEEKTRAKLEAEIEAKYEQKYNDKLTAIKNLPPSAAAMKDKSNPSVIVNDDPDKILFPGEVASG